MFRTKKNAEVDNKTPEQRKGRVEGLLAKEKEKRDRLKELSIDYTFPGYQALADAFSKTLPAKKATKEKKAPAKVEAPKAKAEPVKAKVEPK